VSWYGDSSGSVGQLSNLDPESGNDYVDNVLLEWELGLAVHKFKGTPMSQITPIMFGSLNPAAGAGTFTEFPGGRLSELSDVPSIKTKEQVMFINTTS
jgi:hypothetical protein